MEVWRGRWAILILVSCGRFLTTLFYRLNLASVFFLLVSGVGVRDRVPLTASRVTSCFPTQQTPRPSTLGKACKSFDTLKPS